MATNRRKKITTSYQVLKERFLQTQIQKTNTTIKNQIKNENQEVRGKLGKANQITPQLLQSYLKKTQANATMKK